MVGKVRSIGVSYRRHSIGKTYEYKPEPQYVEVRVTVGKERTVSFGNVHVDDAEEMGLLRYGQKVRITVEPMRPDEE